MNQSYLHCASDSKWYVSNKAGFEANEAVGWCRSVEEGLEHPSHAHLWHVFDSDKWEEQPVVKVVTAVCSRALNIETESQFLINSSFVKTNMFLKLF